MIAAQTEAELVVAAGGDEPPAAWAAVAAARRALVALRATRELRAAASS